MCELLDSPFVAAVSSVVAIAFVIIDGVSLWRNSLFVRRDKSVSEHGNLSATDEKDCCAANKNRDRQPEQQTAVVFHDDTESGQVTANGADRETQREQRAERDRAWRNQQYHGDKLRQASCDAAPRLRAES